MTNPTTKMTNVVSSFAAAALSIFIFVQSRNLSAMGSVFPTTIAVALLVAAMLLLISTIMRKPVLTPTQSQPAGVEAAGHSAEIEYRRGLALIGVMLAWLLSMPFLGLMVSGVLAFGALTFVTGFGKLPLRTLLSIWACGLAVVTGFIFLMTQVLLIPVPRGELF